jgi:FkbM family methyltransferase
MRFPFSLYEQPSTPTTTIDLEAYHCDDHIALAIRRSRTFYERYLLGHLAAHGPRGGVFVDVRANTGNHAVFFGKFLADHVVAVEPHPDLARILERNLRTNGIRGYSLVRCALGEAPGTGRLLLPAGQENNLGGTRVTGLHEPASAAAGALAPIGTLDDTLASLDPAIARLPVRLVKVDVEGMEMAVSRGARELLRRQASQLVVELFGADVREAVFAHLVALGYRPLAKFRESDVPTVHFVPRRRGPASIGGLVGGRTRAPPGFSGSSTTRRLFCPMPRASCWSMTDTGAGTGSQALPPCRS